MNFAEGIKGFRIRVHAIDSLKLLDILNKHLGEPYVAELENLGAIGFSEDIQSSDNLSKIVASGVCVFPECGIIFNEIQGQAIMKNEVELVLQDNPEGMIYKKPTI